MSVAYREVQMIRLALWSWAFFDDQEKGVLRSMATAGSRVRDIPLMEKIEKHRQYIIGQFVYAGVCVDLGAMIGTCELCDHPIRYEFHVKNRQTGNVRIVGSDCIENYVDAGLTRRLLAHKKQAGEERKKNIQKVLLDKSFEVTNEGDGVRRFLGDVLAKFERYGSLTPRQEQAVRNIIGSREESLTASV